MQAVAKYSQAIDLHPTAIYLSNRAFCYVKLENFGLAILDADAALTCVCSSLSVLPCLTSPVLPHENLYRTVLFWPSVPDLLGCNSISLIWPPPSGLDGGRIACAGNDND